MSSANGATVTGSKHRRKVVGVVLLGGEELVVHVDVKGKFYEVFNQVTAHLGLRETEYFGLALLAGEDYQFLILDEKISKIAPKKWKTSPGEGWDSDGRTPLFKVWFRVQFYVDHVVLLREKVSRHLYYLQLKENVLRYDQVYDEEKYFQMVGCALQADFGNFIADKHTTPYFDPRLYFPAWMVAKRGVDYLSSNCPVVHRDLHNLTRTDAQLRYVRECSAPPVAHNLHFYPVRKKKTDKTCTCWLAVCYRGVEVYEDDAGFRNLISTFLWQDIGRIVFDKKKFEIRSSQTAGGRRYTYFTEHDGTAKYLLSLCRSTHQFQMAIQPKLMEIRHLDAEDKKRYKESYIYSDPHDLHTNGGGPVHHRSGRSPGKRGVGVGNQRYSVVSEASSNTTSGVVSDRTTLSFDDGEETNREIIIDCPPTHRSLHGSSAHSRHRLPLRDSYKMTVSSASSGNAALPPQSLDLFPTSRSSGKGPHLTDRSSAGVLNAVLRHNPYDSHVAKGKVYTLPVGLPSSPLSLTPSPTSPGKALTPSPTSPGKALPLTPSPTSPGKALALNTFTGKAVAQTPSGKALPLTPSPTSVGKTLSLNTSPGKPVPLTPSPTSPGKAPSSVPKPTSCKTLPLTPSPAKAISLKRSPSSPGSSRKALSLTPSPTSPGKPFSLSNPSAYNWELGGVGKGVSEGYKTERRNVSGNSSTTSASTASTGTASLSVETSPLFGGRAQLPTTPVARSLSFSHSPACLSPHVLPVSVFGNVYSIESSAGVSHVSSHLEVPGASPPFLHLPSRKTFPSFPAVEHIYTDTASSGAKGVGERGYADSSNIHVVVGDHIYTDAANAKMLNGDHIYTDIANTKMGTGDRVYSDHVSLATDHIYTDSGNAKKATKILTDVGHMNVLAGEHIFNEAGNTNMISGDVIYAESGSFKPATAEHIYTDASKASMLPPDYTYTNVDTVEEMQEVVPTVPGLGENSKLEETMSITLAAGGAVRATDMGESGVSGGEVSQGLVDSMPGPAEGSNAHHSAQSSEDDQGARNSSNTNSDVSTSRKTAAGKRNTPAKVKANSKSKSTHVSVKNQKEALHPDIEQILGQSQSQSLPFIMALCNDLMTGSNHSSVSTDTRRSSNSDSRRWSTCGSVETTTSSSDPKPTSPRPYSWHSEHFDLNASLSMVPLSQGTTPQPQPQSVVDNRHSLPQELSNVNVESSALWTQGMGASGLYGGSLDRYSPELIAQQLMIPSRLNSGGHSMVDSGSMSHHKPLKANVGVA